MADQRTSIALYVCTHKRNTELARLLTTVSAAADQAKDLASLAVVIVDDNPDGRATAVAEKFDGVFEGGVVYRHSGKQNISVARNLGLETAHPMGEWVAMLDDDVVVRPDWLVEHLALQRRTGADATTGPLLLTFPDGPAWLSSQPFADIGLHDAEEDENVNECQTGNSMLRSSFLANNPGIRFEEDLGVIGGEDMVFYHAAVQAGLKAFYSKRVAVEEPEPAERSTLSYQLARARWMGNTEYVTNTRNGIAGRSQLAFGGTKRIVKGLIRPARQVLRGQPPQFRYALAVASEGIGIWAGVAGQELAHR